MNYVETHGSSSQPDEAPDSQEALMTEQQAAAFLNVNPRTLQKWRVEGGGPRFVRMSRRCIRYWPKDIREWAQNRRKSSTSEL